MYQNQIMLIFNTDCLLKKNIHVLKTYRGWKKYRYIISNGIQTICNHGQLGYPPPHPTHPRKNLEILNVKKICCCCN